MATPERIVPIKILGHWEDARVHVNGGDLVIDIPAELIRQVEARQPGRGEKFGYQLLIERYRIVDLVQGRPRRLDVPSSEELAAMRCPAVGGRHERLRATFKGGIEDGSWWIWHNGLAIYGDGETYEEAKADLLEEIANAIDQWKQLTNG